ncbi:MAG: hypothetical protein K0B11_20845 [Mariniphaga sp.]|nr:hypothetical protein [Mariniphaga sp.]
MKAKPIWNYFLIFTGVVLIFTPCCKKDDPFEFEGGIGTLADPYLIATLKQLDGVRYNLGKHFKQVAHVDLSDYGSGTGWKSIGDEYDPFTGSFDGNGYRISNLTMNEDMFFYIGLFGYTSGSVLKNITIESILIKGESYAGGLVGSNGGDIIDCSASGEIEGSGYNNGGLVGVNQENGSIADCQARVKVSGLVGSGGLVGMNDGAITNCYATGDVSVNEIGDNVGGLVAGGLVSSNYGTIENCYATGRVSGEEDIGGLVGKNNGVIHECSVTGDVSGVYFTGGLVGWNWGFITNSTATGNVSGTDWVGGFAGGMQGGAITNCKATGSVTGENIVGGLIGVNVNRTIGNSFALGAVSGITMVGGLAGKNTNDGNIINCYATRNVTGESQAGGLVGINGEEYLNGYIRCCYATGFVSGDNNTGGLVGENFSGDVVYSYYDTETTGQSDTGRGIPKTSAEMMQQATFETWDFITVWGIDEGKGYPCFLWQ